MVSFSACSLMGSTMPEVPRTDRPPSTPSFGLKVFFAFSSPPGMEMTTWTDPEVAGSYSSSSQTSRTASRIICRGTRLMAAFPTGWSRPGRVTRPTPSPPSMRTASGEGSPRETVATTGMPSVTSGSSPASFRTVQRADPSARRSQVSGTTSTVQPFGVRRDRPAGAVPLRRRVTAPSAASAAQVPVVYPQRSCFVPLWTKWSKATALPPFIISNSSLHLNAKILTL